jgi:hypothetical protein
MSATNSEVIQRDMNDEAEKSGARSAIILLVIALLLAGYSVEFGLQTLAWAEARHWAGINPWLNDVPQPLPAPATPAGKGTQVKAYDFQFTAPWAISKIAPSLNFVDVHFDPGQVITFFGPDTQLDTLRELRNSNPAEYQKFMTVFAEHPIESNYEIYQAVYSASPAQLSPFLRQREALRINSLLLWKLSFGTEGGAGIFSFDFGKNHGFQFGDPAKGPAALRVFDDRGHQFRFIFTTTAGSSAKITQDDIDRAVQTLEPVPILER